MIEENNKLGNSYLARVMEEAIELYPVSIFVCGLVNGSKKAKIKEEEFNKLIKKDPKILQKIPHLLDNDKKIRLYNHSIGYLIPMESVSKANKIITLLNVARKEMEKIDSLCIKLSNKSPFSFSSDVKVQFRNISCNIYLKEDGKKLFREFGEIRECYELNGLWEVLFKSLSETLPLLYRDHVKENTSRWFKILPNANAEAAFTSRKICPQCKIAGHDKSTCPGKPLLIKLGIYKEPKPISVKKRDQKKRIKKMIATQIISLATGIMGKEEAEAKKRMKEVMDRANCKLCVLH